MTNKTRANGAQFFESFGTVICTLLSKSLAKQVAATSKIPASKYLLVALDGLIQLTRRAPLLCMLDVKLQECEGTAAWENKRGGRGTRPRCCLYIIGLTTP